MADTIRSFEIPPGAPPYNVDVTGCGFTPAKAAMRVALSGATGEAIAYWCWRAPTEESWINDEVNGGSRKCDGETGYLSFVDVGAGSLECNCTQLPTGLRFAVTSNTFADPVLVQAWVSD